jgi:two-component system, cell cycle sensor histidine kinase and response regulator CckA
LGTHFEAERLRGSEGGSVVREEKSAGTARSPETILVVEDDELIRNAVQRILSTAGYTVLAASTPMEAIEVASNRQVQIHILLTDVGLLGVTGPQLAKLLLADRPGLRVLYISGHSEAHAVPPGRVGPSTAFLQKPFTLEALLREVRELLDQRAPRSESSGGT